MQSHSELLGVKASNIWKWGDTAEPMTTGKIGFKTEIYTFKKKQNHIFFVPLNWWTEMYLQSCRVHPLDWTIELWCNSTHLQSKQTQRLPNLGFGLFLFSGNRDLGLFFCSRRKSTGRGIEHWCLFLIKLCSAVQTQLSSWLHRRDDMSLVTVLFFTICVIFKHETRFILAQIG